MNVPKPQSILIDAVCDKFESAWKAGERPLLRDYVKAVPETGRRELFAELLGLDCQYRRQVDERPRPEEYVEQFPEYAELIHQEFSRPSHNSIVHHRSLAAENFQRDSGIGSSKRSSDPTLPLQKTQLGDYQLLGRIGRGGMGVVFKAQHVRLKKVVALKVLSSATHSRVGLARFRKEMEAVGPLDHPNIVRASDAGEDDGIHYLVMEFVDGIDLWKLVRRFGRLPIEAACEIVRQISMGLDHAHEHGLVHRDIKPSNLMLTASGNVKILDLGLARIHEEGLAGEPLTRLGEAMGSIDYMAPEQSEDARTVDIRADIYSLGCTFFHLLIGHPPYSGTAYRSVPQKIMAHVQAPLPSIRTIREDCPDALERIIRQMLAKRPEDRPARPAEIVDLLASLSIAGGSDACRQLGEKVRAAVLAKTEPLRPTDIAQTDVWASSVSTAQPTGSAETYGTESESIACPFPGLRPFSRDEGDIFFGREDHVEQLLEKLKDHRFLAVVGPSGCGKSSLVLAGLLPTLEAGFIDGVGPHWREAVMRPGEAPFERLAAALLDARALAAERGASPVAAGALEATLRRGPWGLADALNETGLPDGTNLVLVVDQFEEIFRYRKTCRANGQQSANDANAFVDLLLTPTKASPERDKRLQSFSVYVILTMRWDFLDDQFHFTGLTDAMNQSVFFTPRLARDDCQAAVVGPARSFKSDVEQVLVNRLLNETASDPDQLPLLQHTLMRMWRHAAGKTLASNSDAVPARLTLADYELLGNPDQALSNHADERLGRCDPQQQRLARKMFQWLSERSDNQRDIRRPVTLGEVATVATASVDAVVEVVEIFRRPDCSFVMPPAGVPLHKDTILDISHECLLRKWDRLRLWIDEETEAAEVYQHLLGAARRWENTQTLWPYSDLDNALEWKEKENPNAAWAERYGGDFELAMRFLDASNGQRDQKQVALRREYAFDVYLCHSAEDKRAVRNIAEQLKARNVRSWFDEWDLPPGRTWQDELARRIDQIGAAAVFIGPHGDTPWQQMELRGLLNEFTDRKRPVIPVVLPLVARDLPSFLREFTWVDFRKEDPDPLERLIWGVTGDRPD